MEIAENIDILGYEWLGEEDGSVMMAAEDSWRGLAVELNELHFFDKTKRASIEALLIG